MEEQFRLQSARIFPDTPLLSDSAWNKIRAFYLDLAPDSLVRSDTMTWNSQSPFTTHFPDLGTHMNAPSITLLKFESGSQELYIGDLSGNLSKYGQHFELLAHHRLPRPIVGLESGKTGLIRLLSIGQLYPNEGRSGALSQVNDTSFDPQTLLIDQLARPVHFASGNFDGDEVEDFAVCAYGNNLGRLSWFEQNGATFTETVIKNVPGATRVHVEDLNGDGWDELITLFAQGDEGISIFYNEGGKFREDRVLRFPPVYGSNDFEFWDINGDSYKDLIVTHGDNGDNSNVLKPYHGVRIFLNTGNYQFDEAYFFPFYGASKVRCRDYDQDGDVDMFAISFFPDFSQSGSQSLVYLENEGGLNFSPHVIKGAEKGRWMVMDAGDIDQDGDEDILVGSFPLNFESVPPSLLQSWQNDPYSVLFLENYTLP